jgi:excisionase family DNA binding protein
MESIKQDISKLYSITEYSKLMGISRQTVYNWISDKEKKINVVNISGRKYIKLSA